MGQVLCQNLHREYFINCHNTYNITSFSDEEPKTVKMLNVTGLENDGAANSRGNTLLSLCAVSS